MGHRFRRLHRLQQQVVRVTRRLFKICFVCGTFEEEYRSEVIPVRKILTSNKPVCGVGFISPECDHRRMTCTEVHEDHRIPKDFIVEPLNLFSDGQSDHDVPEFPEDHRNGTDNQPNIGRPFSPTPVLDYSTSDDRVEEVDKATSYNSIEVCPSTNNSDIFNLAKTSDASSVERNAMHISIGNYDNYSPSPRPDVHIPLTYSDLYHPLSVSDVHKPVESSDLHTLEGNCNISSVVRKLDITSSSENLGTKYSTCDIGLNGYPQGCTVEKTLSRGKFGYVKVVSNGNNDQRYVLKTCDKARGGREFSILSDCQGQFVSKLCSSFVRADERLIFLKYYELGDLNQWLEKDKLRDKFDEKMAVWIAANTYAAVDFIHRRGILHLDIKPTNILIDETGYPVLSDFGSARRVSECQRSGQQYALTAAYTSPELLQGRRADKMADLWATGCCFYEIVKGRSPFLGKNTAETELKISLGIAPDVHGLSLAASNFLASELNLSAVHRLSHQGGAPAIMSHELFRGIDWNAIRCDAQNLPSPLLRVLAGLDRRAMSFIKRHWASFDTSSSSECDIQKVEVPSRRRNRRRRRQRATIRFETKRRVDGYLGDSEDFEESVH